MNKELWQQTYNWNFENAELRDCLVKFFEALRQAKRIQVDPFEEVVKIRCTHGPCKERYSVNLEAFNNAAMLNGYETLKFLKATHAHFYTEIGFGRMHSNMLQRAHKNKISQYTTFCPQCFNLCPFPWTTWDYHECAGPGNSPNWGLNLSKANTLSWKSSAWVLQINLDINLWRYLARLPGMVYDETAAGWIIPDNQANAVSSLVSTSPFLKNFRHVPKPKPSNAGNRGLALGGRGIAANEIMASIPPDYLPKVKKAIQSVLHPDRDPANREILTKAFQNFEAAWKKWSNV